MSLKRTLQQEIEDQEKRGVLLVLTGPTGAGKDTLFAKLLEKDPSITRIVTTTSRPMRDKEKAGAPYFFIDRSQFEEMIAKDLFFEWVEFRGHLYGTQKKTLEEAMAKRRDVIWHIDAKGVKNIKAKVKEMYPRSVFVFMAASSIEELEERVRKDETKPLSRWNESLVSWEMEQYDDCDYLVVNKYGRIDETVDAVLSIMKAARLEIFHHTP